MEDRSTRLSRRVERPPEPLRISDVRIMKSRERISVQRSSIQHEEKSMKPAVVLILAAAVLALGLAFAGEATGPQLDPGAKAPAFALKGTDGQTHSLDQVKGKKGTLVIFTCNHCPFAKAYEDRLIALAKSYQGKGIGFVAINANDPNVAPDDSFDQMVVRAKEKSLPYPYL